MKTKIVIELDNCYECPYCGQKLTKGYGYALDYFCKKTHNKITSGYVEWESDMNPVPDWCPLKPS